MLPALFLGVEALDELLAGIPALGAPDIQLGLGLSYSAVTVVLLVAPQIVGLLLEPPLFMLADHYPRKWFVCGGLMAMGGCAIVAGLASSSLMLALAMCGWYLGSGCGVGLSQAALMDIDPGNRERTMTRWALLGSLGDLAAPIGFAVLASFSLGWRTGFIVTGVITVLYANLMSWQTFPVTDPSRSAEPLARSLRSTLVTALGNRPLLVWLSACCLCGLLDEILVVFAALHLRDVLGADAIARAVIFSCLTVGMLAGLVIAERILPGRNPMSVLQISAGLCAICYLGWLTVTSLVASGILLFAVGLFCAPLYPIAKAQAYRALPDRSGMVNAMGSLLSPADIALPLGLGLVAEHVGLSVALLVLAAQPIGLFLIAGFMRQTGEPD